MAAVLLLMGAFASPSVAAARMRAEKHAHILDEGTEVTPASCKKSGQYVYRCTVEGCTYSKTVFTPLRGHHMILTEEVAKPGCETRGEVIYTCDREGCGHTQTFRYPATGHHMEVAEVVTEAACTQGGKAVMKCTREGCGKTAAVNTAALGHSWEETETVTAPGEDEPGLRTLTCTVCGETREQEIPALSTVFRVNFPKGYRYTMDTEGTKELRADGELRFTVEILDYWMAGEDFAVTAANAQIRQEPDGSYTISHVEADTTVQVKGIIRDEARVAE